jgi:hypothetical protein
VVFPQDSPITSNLAIVVLPFPISARPVSVLGELFIEIQGV